MWAGAERLRRIARLPAVHFLLIGGLAFVATSREPPGAGSGGDARTIVLTAAEVERARADWTRQHGVPPGREEERRLVKSAVEEEVLYREALARGLDRTSPVVQRRLRQIGEFVSTGANGRSVAEVRALGLDRRDLVVRRHLVQTMRLAAAGADLRPPSETALRAHLARHRARFAQPRRIRLTHVYLDRTRRGAAAETAAAALLAALRAAGTSPEDAPARGDTFLRGHHLPPGSEAELARVLGPGFGATAMMLPLRTWAGPVRSAYGFHLVWVHEELAGGLPPLETVRSQVVQGVLAERRAARLRARLGEWRRSYRVQVEWPRRIGATTAVRDDGDA
jgi:hypothetical protein